jgi:hypothetical protein
VRNLKTLITACKVGLKYDKGLHLGDSIGFANNVATVGNIGFEMQIHTDLIDFNSDNQIISIKIDEFIASAAVLSTDFTLTKRTDRVYEITDPNAISRSLNLLKIPSPIKNLLSSGQILGKITEDDLYLIKKMTEYVGDFITLKDGCIHLNDKLIAIKFKSEGVQFPTLSIPFDVALIITQDIDGGIEVSSIGGKISLKSAIKDMSILFSTVDPPIYDPFGESIFKIFHSRREIIEVISEINKTKKFNPTVYLNKTTATPDLQINFKEYDIEFVNLRTRLKKRIKTNRNQTASINTYGGLLLKILKSSSGLTVKLSPKSVFGLIIDDMYVMGSKNDYNNP